MAGICNKFFNLVTVNFFPRLEKVHRTCIQVRTKVKNTPRLKFPLWYLKKERTLYAEKLTHENEEFVKEVVHDSFGPPVVVSGIPTFKVTSPLRTPPIETGEWKEGSRRCGLISRKIGCYPLWDNNGKIMWTTLLQVIDNHVIKYTPPEEVESPRKVKRFCKPNKYGTLLVGAESGDPQKFTKEYCGLFTSAGLPPKKFLGKFQITSNAVIQPGTPLSACHFQPGEVVDVCGKTVDRGFQGVMKRWGFKGMPASHGVTKTHRRGGNIGAGGGKARVWPGTKMPGQMGNKWRVHRGLKIWRINTKYNVLYVQGLGVPGETNSIIYVYDTLLPLRKHKESPIYFPTYYPEAENPLPEDLYDNNIHPFDHPSITFDVTKS